MKPSVLMFSHNSLADDLADFLRTTRERIVWTDMQLGPVGSPRPDIYSIPKSFVRFAPLVYEVKVSVADFRSDVTSAKWQKYLAFASGVFFAVPAGMVSKADVPEGCGLIVRGPDGWRTQKAPTLRVTETLTRNQWQKLVIDGIDREVSRQMAARRGSVNHTFSAEKAVRKRYGESLGKALSDLNAAESSLRYRQSIAEQEKLRIEKARAAESENHRRQMDLAMREVNAARGELCAALGLPEGSSIGVISRCAKALADRLTADGEVRHLRSQMDVIRRALDACLPAREMAVPES